MIQFTQNAADKVAELIAEENNPKLCLRLYVTGGG
ncbi:MAG: Iron-sulfur cluster insertion protein ErpA, partial [Pseudomonadota bacterium]|nr:Iron-sulfur cluster insertion protein ErpA [Pseudomonadota bacterium]